MNRIVIATILGVIAGAICMLGGMSIGLTMTPVLGIWIFLNRTVLGFVIGSSGLRLHWALHGPLMGFIVGSIFSYGAFLLGQGALLVAGTLVASLIFGFLIELLTTVVFHRPRQWAAPPASQPPAMAA